MSASNPLVAVGFVFVLTIAAASGQVAPYWLPPGTALPADFDAENPTYDPAIYGHWSAVYDWTGPVPPHVPCSGDPVPGTLPVEVPPGSGIWTMHPSGAPNNCSTWKEIKHMFLIPSGPDRGKVGLWQWDNSTQPSFVFHVWDPARPATIPHVPQTTLASNVTCCGFTYGGADDGDLFFTGGNLLPTPDNPVPVQPVETYAWSALAPTDPISRVGETSQGRFYPTLLRTTPSAGDEILCVGGQWTTNTANTLWERWNQGSGTWSGFTPQYTVQGVPQPAVAFDQYPRLFCLSNDAVFFLTDFNVATNGATPPGKTYFASKDAAGVWQLADGPTPTDSAGNTMDLFFESTALLHTLEKKDRLLVFGGGEGDDPTPAPQAPQWPKVYDDVLELDLTATPPGFVARTPLRVRRVFGDAVILPTGKVCLVGGSHGESYGATDPFYFPIPLPEIYDPSGEGSSEWGAPQNPGTSQDHPYLGTYPSGLTYTPRCEHSLALLLPDGSVLVAGGEDVLAAQNPTGSDLRPASTTAEIYYPEYFTNPGYSRPEAGHVPDRTRFSTPNNTSYFKFKVLLEQTGATIDSVVLVSPSAVTHSYSSTQRYIELAFLSELAPSGLEYDIRADAPMNDLGPKGYYMLFVNVTMPNGRVIPTVARWIQLV